MKIFRYDTSGKWFKGNTHLHSVVSDGGLTFSEIERLYLKSGYDFLCRTDHRTASNLASDDFDSQLLWIDGVELDGRDDTGAYYHVVCIGNVEGQSDGKSLNEAIFRNRELGAVIILAHPHWTGNGIDDALRWNFDGVEIYNHVCDWLNGRGRSLMHWNAMLGANPNVLGFASDDAHLTAEHPLMNGGWIMVNLPYCDRAAILSAIKAGNYYSSCGPEIRLMQYDGKRLYVNFSPSQSVRLVGPEYKSVRAPYVGEGFSLTEFTFEIEPNEWEYAYLEIVDKTGRRAWTNNLFIEKSVAC